MKKMEFPGLDESYYEERLENGLLIRVVPKAGFARKYAFLGVHFGSIHTSFTRNGKAFRTPDGIAHYLEHKMFDLPEDNAMNLFALHGGSPNAFTDYNTTAYHFYCTDEFEENLAILLRMVFTPWFTEESVEKERDIIAREIQMYEDSPGSRLYEGLFGTMFAHHPIRVPIAGSVESIRAITAQSLYDCYEAYYQPSNMVLTVAGDVEPQGVFDLARQLSGPGRGPLPVTDFGPREPSACAGTEFTLRMPVSMPMFSLGWKCPWPGAGKDSFRRGVISELAGELLAGETSPLFQRLYEGGLIDSEFSADYDQVETACVFSCTGDSKDPEAVCMALRQELDRICREGFSREHFSRLLRSSLGRRIRALDSFENICYRMVMCEFEGMDYFTFPEIHNSVTPEDVMDFFRMLRESGEPAAAQILPL